MAEGKSERRHSPFPDFNDCRTVPVKRIAAPAEGAES